LTGKIRLKEVVVEKGAQRDAFAKSILDRVSRLPLRRASSSEKNLDGNGLGDSKEILYLLPYRGEFLKPCPGTREYICCGYQILNVGTNCPLDCSYCILQAYFNLPYLRIFVNLEEELDPIFHRIDAHPEKIFRIGTGEFTDSLALDEITRWTDLLLPLFSARKNVILELKTKTDQIGRVLDSNCRDRIVVSWSLNSPYIVAHEEHKTAGLKARLRAARQCQSEGFVLGFHFDPLVFHRGWREGYLRTLDLMDKYLDPKKIIWISFGAFRFMPALKWIIRKRHHATCVLDGEFVVGLDGKMRYFKPIRLEMYSFMKENLDKWSDDLGLYLCMESDEIWRKTLGWSPNNTEGLRRYLDGRVLRFFG